MEAMIRKKIVLVELTVYQILQYINYTICKLDNHANIGRSMIFSLGLLRLLRGCIISSIKAIFVCNLAANDSVVLVIAIWNR